mmetsp:Transcript_64207/g.76008  ORF Transcript_64207/g.76008 Transcript_64207/m.76008 type:complete len:86 (-) Transcript_64207:692-949(-)
MISLELVAAEPSAKREMRMRDGLMSGYHDGREDREDVTRAAGAVAVLFATPKSNNHQGTLDDHDLSSKEVAVMKDKNKENAAGES